MRMQGAEAVMRKLLSIVTLISATLLSHAGRTCT